MKTSIIDSFKLLFSDEYKVSDRDYKVLSDTLVSLGFSENGFESGLASLVKLLIDNGIDFPMTLAYIKKLWGDNYVDFNFINMLSGLVKDGYLRLVRVPKDKAQEVLGIAVEDEEFKDEPRVIVVQGSEKLTEIVNYFKKYFTDRKKIAVDESVIDINEDTQIYPSYVKDFVTRLNTRYLKEFKIKVVVESYIEEDTTESLSLIFKDTSEYTLKDKEIKKLADKYIKRVTMVDDLEVYKESKSELFLGLEVEKTKDYKPLLEPIYKFVTDIEINGVQ